MKIEIECPKCGEAKASNFSEAVHDSEQTIDAFSCNICQTLITIDFITYDKDGEAENV